jgi:hypothetical protein
MGKKRFGTQTQIGVTLDTGALIALQKGSGRVIALLQQLVAKRGSVRIPVGVVGQAWRDGARQAIMARLLASAEVSVVSLDLPLAKACGELCGATSTADVVGASVVLVAREHDDPILTSDVADLVRLDPAARLIAV